MILSPEVVGLDVSSLKPHPKNMEIYSTHISDEFIERVGRFGILEPIIVKEDGTISGHRRWFASRAILRLSQRVKWSSRTSLKKSRP